MSFFNCNRRLIVKIIVASTLAFAALALSGCGGGGPGQPAGFGTVIGRVINGDNSDLIVAATVSCRGVTALTGTDGRFTLVNVPDGIQTVTATKGTSTNSVSILVQANLTANTGDIKLVDGPPPPP